jgi:hypothetical protein
MAQARPLAKQTSTPDYLPRWTKREVVEASGRDPLGLSRVSDALTSYLLPGIITTTERARYYSFYPWAVQDTQRNHGRLSFQEAFMRRDSLFGLASALGKTDVDLTIVGKLQITPRIAELKASGSIKTSFLLLPSNEYGPLDQYYASCLIELGLLALPDNLNDRWAVTASGQQVASAFEQAMGKTPLFSSGLQQAPEVSYEILNNSARYFSLDGLRRADAKAERQFLISTFFSLNEGASERALIRQQTLIQLLDVLNVSVSVRRKEEEFALLYSPHYFGLIFRESTDFRPYRTDAPLSNTRGLWQQFCAHQYLIIALENFLAAVLDVLSPHVEGLTPNAVVKALDHGLIEEMTGFMNVRCETPSMLLQALGVSAIPTPEQCRKNRDVWRPDKRQNEKSVLDEQAEHKLGRLAVTLITLALLYAKWRSADDEQWRAVSAEAGTELWIGMFLPTLDTWVDEHYQWSNAICELLNLIYQRHEQVMFQKRKLEACWISFSNGRYLKEQSLYPQFRSSRHTNSVRILYDLGLVDFDIKKENWIISSAGEEFLSNLQTS